jgi:hypothetical protein
VVRLRASNSFSPQRRRDAQRIAEKTKPGIHRKGRNGRKGKTNLGRNKEFPLFSFGISFAPFASFAVDAGFSFPCVPLRLLSASAVRL